MKRTKIYVCYPFRSDPEKNTAIAKNVSIALWDKGYAPICPHIAGSFFAVDSEDVLNYCIELLRSCEVLLICSNYLSEGMQIELKWWARNKKGVVRFWDLNAMDFKGVKNEKEKQA